MEYVEYKGYTVVIDEVKLEYVIKERITAPEFAPKYKVRRRVAGWGNAGRDEFGNVWVNKFHDMNHLVSHYKNFIDNHITPWFQTDRYKERKPKQ